MTIAQVTLSESEGLALQALGQRQGKTQEEILREAVQQFLARHGVPGRLESLRQARGIWRERQDLPDVARLRGEWDRF